MTISNEGRSNTPGQSTRRTNVKTKKNWIVIREPNGKVKKRMEPSYCGYEPHRKHSKRSLELAAELCRDPKGIRLKELCADDGFMEAIRATGLTNNQLLPRTVADFGTERSHEGFLPLRIPADEAKMRHQRFEKRRAEKLAIVLETYEHLLNSNEYSAWEESQVRYNDEVLAEMRQHEQEELTRQKSMKDRMLKIQTVLETENEVIANKKRCTDLNIFYRYSSAAAVGMINEGRMRRYDQNA